MKNLLKFTAIMVPLLLSLAACPTPEGVTVSGAVTGDYWDLLGPVTIEVSNGSSTKSVDATLASAALHQSGSYTLAGVPTGNCTVVVSYLNAYSYDWDTVDYPPTYSIDGAAEVPYSGLLYETPTEPSTHTITYINVPIADGETIDIYIGGAD